MRHISLIQSEHDSSCVCSPTDRGAAFCSGAPTPSQRQRLAAAEKHFPITGTAGDEEGYFGGAAGLADHLAEVGGGVPVSFPGRHCGEDRATFEEVARRLLGGV